MVVHGRHVENEEILRRRILVDKCSQKIFFSFGKLRIQTIKIARLKKTPGQQWLATLHGNLDNLKSTHVFTLVKAYFYVRFLFFAFVNARSQKRDSGNPPLIEEVRPYLHGKRMVLVLGSSEGNMFSAFSLHAKGCIWP